MVFRRSRCSCLPFPPSPLPFQVTAQRTFDWVLSQKLKAVQKVAEEEENRRNTRRWGEDLVVDCLYFICFTIAAVLLQVDWPWHEMCWTFL